MADAPRGRTEATMDTGTEATVARLRRVYACKSNDEVCAVYGVKKWDAGAWHREQDERALVRAWLAEHLEPVPAHEETAAKFRAAQPAKGDGKPEGTREALEQCARMLDTYAPDLYPANELGQVHFARAMMESVADEIRAFGGGDRPAIPAWTGRPPAESGTYWHWNGDRGCCPNPVFVSRSGTTGKTFVQTGQLGLTHAIDCEDFGGWWMPLPDPALPDPHLSHDREALPA